MRVIECPICKETIDASSQRCRFCSASIDPRAAEAAADAMDRVNQACNDASYMKIAAGTMPVFFALLFVPFFSRIGEIGFLFVLFAVPVMAIRWWAKFSAIVTDDPDFRRARRTVSVVGIAVALFIPVGLILLFLAEGFIKSLQ
ncbi:MAG: hypothetical protein ABSB30_15015 [Terracidiphilus sp.]|jgi:hypothetical protein